MSLFSSFYTGTSGLQTSQNALNATGHNMSNLDTVGYVRQQAYLASNTYNTLSINTKSVANQQYGTGVTFAATRQVRDYFLDLTYRKESGRCSFYETSFGVMEEVETILGELNEVAFQESLSNLSTAIQELSKEPDSAVAQGLLVQSAAAFLERSQSVYSGLSAYQDNLNTNIGNMTNKINDYGNQIKWLNDQIRYIETAGIENANDLRDARNQLIDELSGMAKIEVSETTNGTVTVKLEGEPFVVEDRVYEMALAMDETTGFYTPYWPHNTPFTVNEDGSRNYDPSKAGAVYDMHQLISSDLDTDIGGLKSALLARGDHRGNYTDLADKDTYNKDIANSVLMNVQAEFDQLIHGIVNMINTTLKEAADPASGYLCGVDGQPLQLFERVSGYEGAPNEDGNHTETLFTTANIIMNQDIVEQPTLLNFIKDNGDVDFGTLQKMKDAFSENNYTLNPNVLNKTNFMDYYAGLVSQVGNSGFVYKSIMEYQQQTVETTENARQGVIGVSSDEEMSNMIRFQNAYNASSRYINAVNDMLEHLITKLA